MTFVNAQGILNRKLVHRKFYIKYLCQLTISLMQDSLLLVGTTLAPNLLILHLDLEG